MTSERSKRRSPLLTIFIVSKEKEERNVQIIFEKKYFPFNRILVY